MKKIIVAKSILDEIGVGDTIFSRGVITTYPAGTCEEILNIHDLREADVIIMDSALPLMGGARLCTEIRRDSRLKKVSIILICGRSAKSLAECQDAGANTVITKPIDPLLLFSKLSELLLIPQRQDLRALLTISVKGSEGKNDFFAISSNISMSGMLLETDHAVKKGEKLKCSFKVGHSEIAIECIVTRVESTPSGRRRFGVKFVNSDTKSLIIIDNFIKSKMKH